MANADIKTELKELKEMMEISIQQKSAHHSDLLKKIGSIEKWELLHEQQDDERFKLLPSKQDITKAVSDEIKITVNGKIDKIALHLSQQDENLAELGKKIAPIDGAKKWFGTFFKGIIYIGSIGVAIGGIVTFIQWLLPK